MVGQSLIETAEFTIVAHVIVFKTYIWRSESIDK
ncbi:MAG: hypothetical protein UY72_C0025G0013 [Candidatus Uhrbacteria bacterium GW2011_GWD2_52_7]|uniref:Uncharacterized protein n=1 Tax=Candidatus Uhrbacteria bacterium GW2011_GWD2_52_7 TaxID=1618989 RepID=A0A0G1ZPG1_9BACT|nr:MAG: hypothetical protein UY72_C0025G0013 [Candidatus Uhrbacteria bacterium GW2011_GWD2_52_7]